MAQAQSATTPLTLRSESGNLVLEGVPQRDAAMTERLARYINGRDARFLDWQPDGSLLIATRFGDVEQVHRVTAPMGSREQLTFYPEPISVAAANTNGFVFLKDKGGDENSQLYYYKNADKSIRLLTDGKSLNGSPIWAHDGKRVGFPQQCARRRELRHLHRGCGFQLRPAPRRRRPAGHLVSARLVAGRFEAAAVEVHLDQRELPVRGGREQRHDHAARRRRGGERTASRSASDRTSKGDDKVSIKAAQFAPDGRGVYIVTDESSEFAQLKYYDPITQEKRLISPDGAQWDVDAFDVSPDGRYVAYVMNEDGRSRLTVIDNQMKLELSPPGIPDGRIRELTFDQAGQAARVLRRVRAVAARMFTSTTSRRARSSAGRRAKPARSTTAPSSRPSWCTTPRGIVSAASSARSRHSCICRRRPGPIRCSSTFTAGRKSSIARATKRSSSSW